MKVTVNGKEKTLKDGATIAVLGNGFNHVFPPTNEALMGQIAEKGLLLTEFAPETQPFPGMRSPEFSCIWQSDDIREIVS